MLTTFSLVVNWNSIIIVTVEVYKVGYSDAFSFSFPKLEVFCLNIWRWYIDASLGKTANVMLEALGDCMVEFQG